MIQKSRFGCFRWKFADGIVEFANERIKVKFCDMCIGDDYVGRSSQSTEHSVRDVRYEMKSTVDGVFA